ncbi:sugar kinase [Paraoerskovia sediminicola]|nr:sugar kinase [Paraoerskovia sediminicola]
MALVVPRDGQSLQTSDALELGNAGAESNVAISLARLGTVGSWASRLGDDPLGRRVVGQVEALGATVDLVELDPTAPTGVMFKDPRPNGSPVHYYRAGSAASRMTPDFATAVLATDPRWVHTSGVTSGLSLSCRQTVTALLDGARAHGIGTSFDINYRPAIWRDLATAARVIADAASRAEVVLVGLDEAERLWGCTTEEDVRRILPGVPTIVVKNGAQDATSLGRTGRTTVPALPVDVVEPVGAGDAFAAGYLHAHLLGLEDAAKLRLGHLMAGIALRSHSDQGELPTTPDDLVARAVSGEDWPATARTAELRPPL